MKTFIFFCENLDQGYRFQKTITAKSKAVATRYFNQDYDNVKIVYIKEVKLLKYSYRSQ